MAKKSLFQYDNRNDYNVDANSRPTDGSSVSKVSHEVEYNGVNVVVDCLPQNCEVGDMIIYDKETMKHKLLKMDTYDAASFDTDKYIKSNMFWHVTVTGVGLFLFATQRSARWAASNEYRIAGIDLTQAGSFTFLSTGYQAKNSATTIEWAANATLESVKAQFATGNGAVLGNASYNSIAIVGSDLIITVNGTGTNLVTIGSLTGGAANIILTDYSETVRINGVTVETKAHRSFQGSTVTSLFGTYFTNLTFPATSACYSVTKVNRSWWTGVALQVMKAYCAASGSTSFVSDITANTSAPMTEATFLACKDSDTPAEVEVYTRNKGSWDNYLRNMLADPEDLKGTVGLSYGDFGERSKARASIEVLGYDGSWKPAYPADYAASQMGVTVAGYTTGFEPGNLYQSNTFEFASFMNDEKRLVLNPFISAVGGTTLGGSDLWTGDEGSGYIAWVFYATIGRLRNYYKMDSNGVRGSLAFKF